ncbi:hypothetical protein NI17_004475 [Thermobifida halotolerans]|uniref:Uncharacterized protein n=2 Tax=Thermobifida halotolerans TaxID=483545 RepID=A0AA97M4N0_9ACTN|nr:hypothetical protein [Thermobifida halotolerans]UOE20489.1 hypothetical protein NI17_004475 [Thermobifida halotolerans]
MAETLRDAETVLAEPVMLRLRGGGAPAVAAALKRLGLVVYDPGSGRWTLTRRGREVRERLAASADAHQKRPHHRSGSGRVTVHPELVPEQVERLENALTGKEPRDVREDAKPGPGPVVKGCGIGLLAAVGVVLAVLVLSSEASGAVLLGALAVWGAVIGLTGYPQYRRWRIQRQDAQEETADSLEDRFVTAAMLDESGRELLARAQQAVDTVLDSSPHRQGLLLDEARNRVVLKDVEWSLAQSLLHQSEARRRIDATPTPGERSRAAAERARAALERDTAQVEERVRLLESYAAKVRAAEAEEQDRRAAAALEAIAVDVAQAGAAHPHHAETLASLVEAQEAALRVAALTDPEL